MIGDILNRSFLVEKSVKQLFNSKLDEAGLSKTQFEKLSGIQRRSLDGILDKSSKQTDIIHLLKLSEFLELSVDEILVYHFKDRASEEIRELQEAIEITFINKYFDLKALSNLGFFEKESSLSALKDRICKFFLFETIFDFENNLNGVLYSRTKRSFSDKMKDFWIKSSYKYFELINNPNEYSRKDLVELIPKIKPYTQNIEKGLITVFRALYNVGVTVVFQPLLPKTQIRGATFIVNTKPCIVITDFNKNYATIWFSLIHELHHVLYDLELLERIKYHLTGEPDLFLIQEDKANKFAGEYLLSSEKLQYIEPMIHNSFMVKNFASECQVHPSIIYSQYQFRQSEIGNNYWAAFKDFFPDMEKVKRGLTVNNWDTESLEEAALKTKSSLTI
ncbi:helix-turn-helix transcriptional regulator [Dyadobacter sp. CY345]|uniref:helix-turn-helix transcriptional regulator n=1 Tax=Dyadobacter sp. CY345 TaxID=2909335 RepID=UPI001F470544|nr:helix-turn-helix transcriptional regulator [Dyadobacter sp. CY345]MCF2445821.1 helix-turn-helix transcriptional regulator [Dyadobacter sp. CY345]